jgi:hypothetical protein
VSIYTLYASANRKFILQLVNKLGKPFSEGDKEKLARSLELNYAKIRSVMSAQENTKEQSKPTILNWETLVGDSLL